MGRAVGGEQCMVQVWWLIVGHDSLPGRAASGGALDTEPPPRATRSQPEPIRTVAKP